MKPKRKLEVSTPRDAPYRSMKEFITGRKLGEGAYATVKKAIHIESRKTVAIKEIVISTLNENDFENIENEVRIHQKLEHEHVIKLLGYFVEAGSLYMVLENAEGGNLYKYLTNNYPMDKEEVRRIWAQTVRGVGYLHEKGVLMRDIKPENVILAKDVTAKLCDFGWAAWMTDEGYRKIRGGTYIYMSPEALRGELQGLESDVWSLGVLLFELNHAMEPFALGVTCEQQLEFVVGGKIRFKTTLDPKIRGLIEKCLAFEAGKRPTLAELQDLEYVKGVAEVGMVYEEICMVEGELEPPKPSPYLMRRNQTFSTPYQRADQLLRTLDPAQGQSNQTPGPSHLEAPTPVVTRAKSGTLNGLKYVTRGKRKVFRISENKPLAVKQRAKLEGKKNEVQNNIEVRMPGTVKRDFKYKGSRGTDEIGRRVTLQGGKSNTNTDPGKMDVNKTRRITVDLGRVNVITAGWQGGIVRVNSGPKERVRPEQTGKPKGKPGLVLQNIIETRSRSGSRPPVGGEGFRSPMAREIMLKYKFKEMEANLKKNKDSEKLKRFGEDPNTSKDKINKIEKRVFKIGDRGTNPRKFVSRSPSQDKMRRGYHMKTNTMPSGNLTKILRSARKEIESEGLVSKAAVHDQISKGSIKRKIVIRREEDWVGIGNKNNNQNNNNNNKEVLNRNRDINIIKGNSAYNEPKKKMDSRFGEVEKRMIQPSTGGQSRVKIMKNQNEARKIGGNLESLGEDRLGTNEIGKAIGRVATLGRDFGGETLGFESKLGTNGQGLDPNLILSMNPEPMKHIQYKSKVSRRKTSIAAKQTEESGPIEANAKILRPHIAHVVTYKTDKPIKETLKFKSWNEEECGDQSGQKKDPSKIIKNPEKRIKVSPIKRGKWSKSRSGHQRIQSSNTLLVTPKKPNDAFSKKSNPRMITRSPSTGALKFGFRGRSKQGFEDRGKTRSVYRTPVKEEERRVMRVGAQMSNPQNIKHTGFGEVRYILPDYKDRNDLRRNNMENNRKAERIVITKPVSDGQTGQPVIRRFINAQGVHLGKIRGQEVPPMEHASTWNNKSYKSGSVTKLEVKKEVSLRMDEASTYNHVNMRMAPEPSLSEMNETGLEDASLLNNEPGSKMNGEKSVQRLPEMKSKYGIKTKNDGLNLPRISPMNLGIRVELGSGFNAVSNNVDGISAMTPKANLANEPKSAYYRPVNENIKSEAFQRVTKVHSSHGIGIGNGLTTPELKSTLPQINSINQDLGSIIPRKKSEISLTQDRSRGQRIDLERYKIHTLKQLAENNAAHAFSSKSYERKKHAKIYKLKDPVVLQSERRYYGRAKEEALLTVEADSKMGTNKDFRVKDSKATYQESKMTNLARKSSSRFHFESQNQIGFDVDEFSKMEEGREEIRPISNRGGKKSLPRPHALAKRVRRSKSYNHLSFKPRSYSNMAGWGQQGSNQATNWTYNSIPNQEHDLRRNLRNGNNTSLRVYTTGEGKDRKDQQILITGGFSENQKCGEGNLPWLQGKVGGRSYEAPKISNGDLMVRRKETGKGIVKSVKKIDLDTWMRGKRKETRPDLFSKKVRGVRSTSFQNSPLANRESAWNRSFNDRT